MKMRNEALLDVAGIVVPSVIAATFLILASSALALDSLRSIINRLKQQRDSGQSLLVNLSTRPR